MGARSHVEIGLPASGARLLASRPHIDGSHQRDIGQVGSSAKGIVEHHHVTGGEFAMSDGRLH